MRGTESTKRRAAALALGICLLALSACSANLKTATCGWSSSMPSNGGMICRQTYQVLGDIVLGERRGDNSLIRRHVGPSAVAERIIRYGQSLRRQHLKFLRVTPSLELTMMGHRLIGVAAYLVGDSDQGKIDDPETVTERVEGNTVVVTADQPGEHW